MVEPGVIDQINILEASKKAMLIAVSQLTPQPDLLFVDGNMKLATNISQQLIIDGDALSHSIAAASILAKVSRDKYIGELCDKHENLNTFYGLASNKGYGTAQHIEGIKQHGMTKWHRKTFGICRDYN